MSKAAQKLIAQVLGGAGLIVLGNQHQLVGNGGMHTFLIVIGVIILLGTIL